MLNNSSNQNNLSRNVTIVTEYEPEGLERVSNTVNNVKKYVAGVLLAGAASSITAGVCMAGSRDISQCFIPIISAGTFLTGVICIGNYYIPSRVIPSNQTARLEVENEQSILEGIPASSIVLPSAPELSLESTLTSPRLSSNPQAERVRLQPLQVSTIADLVFVTP